MHSAHKSPVLNAALFTALLLAGGCGTRKPEKAEPPHKVVPKPTPPPAAPLKIADDTLNRGGIILAALHATTAAALSRDDKAEQAQLRGRQFELRIRFGCPGEKNPGRSWSYDEDKNVLRVQVKSDLTDKELPASDLLGKSYQGAVGFALGRPWLLTAGCPLPGFAGIGSSEPTIVIAQLFTDTDSRVQRPQASYQLTKEIPAEQQPAQGLDLVLSGRLAELSDGRPIHCAGRDGAPACIVSARIDRVAVENPADGSILGQWGSGAGPG